MFRRVNLIVRQYLGLSNESEEPQEDLRREHPTTLSRHPSDVSNSVDEDLDEYEGDASEFGSEAEVSSSGYYLADDGLDELSEISELSNLSGISGFTEFEKEIEEQQKGGSFFEFRSEVTLESDSDSDDSDSSESESDEEEEVGDGMDFQGDPWRKPAYAVELDRSDISDDAIDSAFGRDFVMDMRESLASSVTVRRELPDDAEMEDVGFGTSEVSAVPGEEAPPAPAGQQSICSLDEAVLTTMMPGLPGGDSSLPACQGPPPVGRTQEQVDEAIRYLLEFSRTYPAAWEVLLGQYLDAPTRTYWPRQSCWLGRQSSWSMGAEPNAGNQAPVPTWFGPGPILLPARARRFLPAVHGCPDHAERRRVPSGRRYLGRWTDCDRRACPGAPPGTCRMVSAGGSLSCVGQCPPLPPGTAGRAGVLKRAVVTSVTAARVCQGENNSPRHPNHIGHSLFLSPPHRSGPRPPRWSTTLCPPRSAQETRKETSFHGGISTRSGFFPPPNIALTGTLADMIPLPSESRNPRRPPEETGPFGRRRNARYDHARSRTRTGTPAKKENPNVAEFSRLFAQQQEEERAHSSLPKSSSSSSLEGSRKPTEKVATECILYGYKNKDSEWKVIDKYERISQGMICEDYPRSDPNATNKSSHLLSGGDVVIRANLTADANRKSKRYAGGYHWIKVTFDSTTAADRACFFSPQEIDGHLVFCELYHGQGPAEDIPIPKGSAEANRTRSKVHHTLTSSHSTSFLHSKEPERSTMPRSFTMNNLSTVGDMDEEDSQLSTATASSATATATEQAPALRQRPVQESKPESEFMTHIPTVRRAVLRPISEALPPQPTVSERILRSIPILSWFTGDIVGDGPQFREDGTFDYQKSNLYWRFWYMIDQILGTDFCGLKEES